MIARARGGRIGTIRRARLSLLAVLSTTLEPAFTLLVALALSPAVARAERVERAEHVLHIYKNARKMVLEVGGKPEREFRVGLGGAPAGDKSKQGDQRTPEGEFFIAWKNAASAFHRFLALSYPMPRHARRGVEEGLIRKKDLAAIEDAVRHKTRPPQDTALGGFVGIHGGGGGSDWTLGCIAVTDDEIEWLFARMKTKDRVVVHP